MWLMILCEVYGQLKRKAAEQIPGVLAISYILYSKELFILKKTQISSWYVTGLL